MWISLESKKKDTEKAENAFRGTQFEAAIVKILSPKNNIVQYKGKVNPDIQKNAIDCSEVILSKICNGRNPAMAEQVGQHTSTMTGDIAIKMNPKADKMISLEMKYISGTSNGTWHNTSADLLPNQLPEYNFLTIREAFNTPLSEMMDSDRLTIPVTASLSFICDGKRSFIENLKIAFEPFEPFDIVFSGKDELDDFSPNNRLNSPLGDTHTSTIADNHEEVIVSRLDDGKLYTRTFTDEYPEDADDEYDDDEDINNYFLLENQSCWIFKNNSEEDVISPADLYKTVMTVLGKTVMGYLGRSHFNTIMGNKELPQKVLSLFCDKKESSDKMENGKRPDFLIVFDRDHGKTSVFNCLNYHAGNSDAITFDRKTDNRYSIGNDSVMFSFQYGWQGGASIKNPTIRVFLES